MSGCRSDPFAQPPLNPQTSNDKPPTSRLPLYLRGSIRLSSPNLFFAPAILGALEHRVADALRLKRVPERRRAGLAVGERLEEIGNLVDERVLVADLQARDPPVAHVGVLAVGDVDRTPA